MKTNEELATKEELEKIAEQSLMQMPQDLEPGELEYVLSYMLKKSFS